MRREEQLEVGKLEGYLGRLVNIFLIVSTYWPSRIPYLVTYAQITLYLTYS